MEKYLVIESLSITYQTTHEQRERIQEGLSQLGQGENFTNEQVEMEIDKCLIRK